jgi:HEAT repeat protein
MPLIRNQPTAASATSVDDLRRSLIALQVGEPDARWSAARGLAAQPSAVPMLEDAARRETDPRVREALFTSLACIGTPAAVDAVVTFIRSDEADVRTCALDAMRIMAAAVRPRLPALLADVDDDVRILSCDLVRALPSAEASELLSGVLDNDSAPNVCAAAVDVLAEVGDVSALPSLERCARRFADQALLVFAVEVAGKRIADERRDRHG